jgi:hypothetical protein
MPPSGREYRVGLLWLSTSMDNPRAGAHDRGFTVVVAGLLHKRQVILNLFQTISALELLCEQGSHRRSASNAVDRSSVIWSRRSHGRGTFPMEPAPLAGCGPSAANDARAR